MSKGGYIGGSTVIRTYALRSRRLRKGLLALERAELERRKAREPAQERAQERAQAAVEAEPPPVKPEVQEQHGHATPRHIHHRQIRALRAAHRERRRLAMEAARRAQARRPADKPSNP